MQAVRQPKVPGTGLKFATGQKMAEPPPYPANASPIAIPALSETIWPSLVPLSANQTHCDSTQNSVAEEEIGWLVIREKS